MGWWKKTGRTATTYSVRWQRHDGMPSDPELVREDWEQERYDRPGEGPEYAWSGPGRRFASIEGMPTTPSEAIARSTAERQAQVEHLEERLHLARLEVAALEQLGRRKAKPARRKRRAS